MDTTNQKMIASGENQANYLFIEDEVRWTLSTLFPSDATIEIRVLGGVFNGQNIGFSHTLSGYFDNANSVIEQLLRLKVAKGIYVTINEVNPELLSRSYNILKKNDNTTSDKDIIRRRFLPVDIDPVRVSGTSATGQAKGKAKEVAQKVYNYLNSLEWPEPICADSGNGYHILYKIDERQNDNGLVMRVLTALASMFDTAEVKIDLAVSNPARIMRLYGTRACKGSEVPSLNVYHRMSSVIRGAA